MTLMALVVAVTAGAQGTTIHEYPWNPDWNNDNFVGSEILLAFFLPLEVSLGIRLSLVIMMGRRWRSCYWNQRWNIILDSIFVEFELEDVSHYFVSGCPDPITDTLYSRTHSCWQSRFTIMVLWDASGSTLLSTLFHYRQWHITV